MKPTIVCENFTAPEYLSLFIKEAVGEILRVSPYDSYLEAKIRKDDEEYVMEIAINYPEGRFATAVRDSDLKRVITHSTADIFTQVQAWRKFRFGEYREGSAELSSDFIKQVPIPDTALGEPPRLKKPLRVLIVDDDMESITPLKLCLERLGCSNYVVNNGFEAIHEIVSSERVYDVMILDWSMPEMTGGQALLNAQKVIFYSPLSNTHWEKERLPVVTYSGRDRSEINLPECRDFRHLDHWKKPASYLQLFHQVTETLSKLEAAA